ncbi:MAG TPA: hypothetical protein VGD80_39740 [Kofleriaceae bacterium]
MAVAGMVGCGSPDQIPTVEVAVGGQRIPVGKRDQCDAVTTSTSGLVSLAVGLSASGNVTGLRLIDGSADCAIDERSTARTLIVIASGAGLMPAAQRAEVWNKTDTLDLDPTEDVLRSAPDLSSLMRSPSQRDELLAQVHTAAMGLLDALPRSTNKNTRGITPDVLGMDGLMFEAPQLGPDSATILLPVKTSPEPAYPDPSFEIKAVVIDQTVWYLKGSEMLDVVSFTSADVAHDETVLSIPLRDSRLIDLRVIAPSLIDPLAPMTLADEAIGFRVDQRSLMGYGLQALSFLVPDFYGRLAEHGCHQKVVSSFTEVFTAGFVEEIAKNHNVDDIFLSMVKKLGFEALPKIAAECLLHAKWYEVFEWLQQLLGDAAFATQMLTAFTSGPQLAVHHLDVCAACPNATDDVTPVCSVSGGHADCTPRCVEGATDTVPCGNCGTLPRTCTGGVWMVSGTCTGAGECAPSSSESCGSGGVRTCSATCSWSQCNGNAPAAPANVTATYDSSRLRDRIAWEAVPGASEYTVYWGTSPGVTTASNKLPPTVATSYDHAVAPGTYYYRISATSAFGESTLSSEVSVTVPVAAPTTPTGVSVVYQSAQRWNYVSWSAVSGATSYKVYWGTSPGVTTGSSVLGTTTTADFGHTGVVAGATYYYRVAALNGGGQSGLSSEVSVTVPVAAPTTPTGVSVVYQSAQHWNYISWGSVAGATLYKVYWGTSPGITTSSMVLTPTSTTDYGHSGVVSGAHYYYRVAATNSAGQGPLSTEVSVVVP